MGNDDISTKIVRSRLGGTMPEEDRIVVKIAEYLEPRLGEIRKESDERVEKIYGRLDELRDALHKAEVARVKETGAMEQHSALLQARAEAHLERLRDLEESRRWATRQIVGIVIAAVVSGSFASGLVVAVVQALR